MVRNVGNIWQIINLMSFLIDLVKSKFLIEIRFNAFVNLKRGDRGAGGGGGGSFFSKFSFNVFYVIRKEFHYLQFLEGIPCKILKFMISFMLVNCW